MGKTYSGPDNGENGRVYLRGTDLEDMQSGKGRAEYGKRMLQGLSEYLNEKFGKGFSVSNLKNIRQFYKTYASDQIGETVFSQLENHPSVVTGRESVKNNWSLRE